MKRFALTFVFLALVIIGITGCFSNENPKLAEQRERAIATRAEVMARAEAVVPAPQPENFPARRLLAEYTRRQDIPNHPWYTYILSDIGTITYYFVSKGLPVSTNAFLSSTESVYKSANGNVVLTAPSLDGVYYGGAGASSNMNGWIFIDAATNAMGIVYGAHILTFDAPLILETEPQLIRIAPSKK